MKKKPAAVLAAAAAFTAAVATAPPAAATAPAPPKIAAGQEVTFPAGTEQSGTAFTRLRVGNTSQPGWALLKTTKTGPTALSTLNYLPSSVPFINHAVGNSSVAISELDPNFPGVTVKASTEADISTDTFLVTQKGVIDSGAAGRKFDTRTSGSAVPAGGVYKYSTGKPNTTLFGNVTSTQSTSNGWIVAYPCATGRPNVSTVNYTAGVTKTNFTTVRTDANGDVCFYTSVPTHILWDEQGQTTNLVPQPTRLVDTRVTQPGGYAYNTEMLTVHTSAVPGSVIFGNLTTIVPSPATGVSVYNTTDSSSYRQDEIVSEVNNDPVKNAFFAARVDPKGNVSFRADGAVGLKAHFLVDSYLTVAPNTNIVKLPEDVVSTSASATRIGQTWRGSNVGANYFSDTSFAESYKLVGTTGQYYAKRRSGNIPTVKNMQLGILSPGVAAGDSRIINFPTTASNYLYQIVPGSAAAGLPPYPNAWTVWTPTEVPQPPNMGLYAANDTAGVSEVGALTVNNVTTTGSMTFTPSTLAIVPAQKN